jgi:hypothetical protein
MTRFTEELLTTARRDRDEDGFPDQPVEPQEKCPTCSKRGGTAFATIGGEQICTVCFDTPEEFAAWLQDDLECTCRFAGDMADASDCDLHGSHRRQPVMVERVRDYQESEVA